MNLRIRRVLAALPLLFGCAGNEATPPTDDDVGDETTTDGSDTTDTGDATDDATDTATDTGDDACLGPEDCFACEPTNSIELSNACTDATCEPFANTPERLPLLERDGGLPPLP